MFHAQKVLDICQREGIDDFDLAFAYEALARASAAGAWRGYCSAAGRLAANSVISSSRLVVTSVCGWVSRSRAVAP